MGSSASKTQAQAVTPDDPFALTERVDRDRYDVTLDYDRMVGQRWRWLASAGAASVSNELLAVGGVGTTVEDRDQMHIGTGFSRQLSAKTAIGFDVQFQQNSLDDSGDEDHSGRSTDPGRCGRHCLTQRRQLICWRGRLNRSLDCLLRLPRTLGRAGGRSGRG